jgi:hypothetical protein
VQFENGNFPEKKLMITGYNSSQVESLVTGWHTSGMTQTDYAKLNNVTIHTLRYWLYKRKNKSAQTSAFVELKDIFKGHDILLRYPNGVELHIPAGTSLQAMKALINL